MTENVKRISTVGIGIALFVVFTLCLQVPVFENYYLCLGYVVMAVYCYSVGTLEGTLVGVLGTILYCVLTGGLRGMPGWAAGNIVIGVEMGALFRYTRNWEPGLFRAAISVLIITLAVAEGILGVKSLVEHILYAQPFLVRVAKNTSAFLADTFVLVVSLPFCRLLHGKIKA